MPERNERGQFVEGNCGGPGRPRRAIEREYLAVLSEAVGLDDWRAIVVHAVEAAKQGDEKARTWLARYVIGDKPITLTELMARELLDIDADLEVLAKADEISEPSSPLLRDWNADLTLVERAESIRARLAGQKAAEARKERRAARAQPAAGPAPAPADDAGR